MASRQEKSTVNTFVFLCLSPSANSDMFQYKLRSIQSANVSAEPPTRETARTQLVCPHQPTQGSGVEPKWFEPKALRAFCACGFKAFGRVSVPDGTQTVYKLIRCHSTANSPASALSMDHFITNKRLGYDACRATRVRNYERVVGTRLAHFSN